MDSGVYREKVFVPKNKTNLVLVGTTNTWVSWNDTAKSANGTFYCWTFIVFASNFTAYNVNFQFSNNTSPISAPGSKDAQAVVVRVGGDKAIFYSCGLYGHYFKDSFIEGSIDFIFENGRSIYQNSITAQGREVVTDNSGFSFINCNVGGTGQILLGRAWRPFASVVFAKSYPADNVASSGWNDLDDHSTYETVFFGDFENFGPGSNRKFRVSYSKNLGSHLDRQKKNELSFFFCQ
ncbi:hypothetical protein MKW92_029089 [Papaver armeniacum]|nr:hypothetical protein MKW92_029089 [Papaver armeniacum]